MRRTLTGGAAVEDRPVAEVPVGDRSSDRPAERMRTEFPFLLPRGYVDRSGTVHRDGVMRLARARDELVPLRDDQLRENPAYLSVFLLSRVVIRLGALDDVHTGV